SGIAPRTAFTGGSRSGSAVGAERRSAVRPAEENPTPDPLVGVATAVMLPGRLLLPVLRAATRAPGFFKNSIHCASSASDVSTPYTRCAAAFHDSAVPWEFSLLFCMPYERNWRNLRRPSRPSPPRRTR